jgi:hypothetical protein
MAYSSPLLLPAQTEVVLCSEDEVSEVINIHCRLYGLLGEEAAPAAPTAAAAAEQQQQLQQPPHRLN